MSRKRTKAEAKRRTRGATRLTPEQRIELVLRQMEAQQAELARRERHEWELIEAMTGEPVNLSRPKRNEWDQWELDRLQRMNRNRSAERLTLRLPDSAYEARTLWRYIVD